MKQYKFSFFLLDPKFVLSITANNNHPLYKRLLLKIKCFQKTANYNISVIRLADFCPETIRSLIFIDNIIEIVGLNQDTAA